MQICTCMSVTCRICVSLPPPISPILFLCSLESLLRKCSWCVLDWCHSEGNESVLINHHPPLSTPCPPPFVTSLLFSPFLISFSSSPNFVLSPLLPLPSLFLVLFYTSLLSCHGVHAPQPPESESTRLRYLQSSSFCLAVVQCLRNGVSLIWA
uniref:Uncharacterized protein n=1 Tax=Leishmania guyanensis TaxID=5670 RepID=A0A1E1IWY2_LEIGU|nr:Hypothetical protein BN36_2333070 [Leishmania guyanensis]